MELLKDLKKAKQASFKLALADDVKISELLNTLADLLEARIAQILGENKKDLEEIAKDDAIFDRVFLNEERILAMAKAVREIAEYNSPIGIDLEHRILKNSLELKKVTVPLGVIGVIFEARPNVVIDIFALCFKSKNVCVMKGGSQSERSNKILVKIIKEVVKNFEDCITLLPNDKKLLTELMQANQYLDVIIPRGGESLINFVRKNSAVPVIETGAGVVHIYFDEFGDLKKGSKIIFNAKTSRPSVCNALDTLIIHKNSLNCLGKLCRQLSKKNVKIFADKESLKILKNSYPSELLKSASEENFGKEYLALKMSVKTVANLNEAVEHINKYGSRHSEAIITENKKNADYFLEAVDSACVYVNASTRFTDGAEFGLGAEVGISTQKLHARGPMGIKELTTYKWKIWGNGQVRT